MKIEELNKKIESFDALNFQFESTGNSLGSLGSEHAE